MTTYTVDGRVTVCVSVTVDAKSEEEAETIAENHFNNDVGVATRDSDVDFCGIDEIQIDDIIDN